jgi:hypothetical protein
MHCYFFKTCSFWYWLRNQTALSQYSSISLSPFRYSFSWVCELEDDPQCLHCELCKALVWSILDRRGSNLTPPNRATLLIESRSRPSKIESFFLFFSQANVEENNKGSETSFLIAYYFARRFEDSLEGSIPGSHAARLFDWGQLPQRYPRVPAECNSV